MPEQTLEHWPTERMIMEGHADYATPGDLEALDESILIDIAQICDVDQFAPDECIPCLAHTMVLERRKAAEEAVHAELDKDTDDYYPDAEVYDEEGEVKPRLAAILAAVPPWTESDLGPTEDPPVAEQFASKVAELSLLVEELLEGPPIPPPGVDISELALLTLAADRWVKITDAQGVSLATDQQQMLDATRELVARLRS